MRRKYLNEYQLNQVIKLKQSGASWLKIEKMTNIPRRSAKRAYDEWERSSSADDLKEVRSDVAREEFRKHLSHLIAIAESLGSGLEVPAWPDERRGSETFLRELWSKDDLTGYSSDERRTLRRNLMLFEALKNHSCEKVKWQLLEDWKEGWDECVGILTKLTEQTERVVTNILDQKPALRREIDKGKIDRVSREALALGVLAVVWNGILDGRPEEASGQIKATELPAGKTAVNFGDRAARASLTFAEKGMTQEVVKACAWAVDNLCRGESAPLITHAVGVVSAMRRRKQELEDTLDPLVLTPMILRTRCELCPV